MQFIRNTSFLQPALTFTMKKSTKECKVAWAMVLGKLPVPGRPIISAYGRTGTCCACSMRDEWAVFFCFVSCRPSYLPFLMPHLLGDGWTYRYSVVSTVITQRWLSVTTGGVLTKAKKTYMCVSGFPTLTRFLPRP